MDFRLVSAERYQTHVDVVPSDPEGYFIIEGDPFVPRFSVGKIVLQDIKPRHARALQRGDTSAMNRYVVTHPDRPGFISFTNCSVGVPDPLQPIGTSIPVPGAQEMPMDGAVIIIDD